MENEKIEEQLDLALQLPKNQLIENKELRAGYDATTDSWELIVRFSGSDELLEKTAEKYGGSARILIGQYGIVTLPSKKVEAFSMEKTVIYIEKPKNIYEEIQTSKQSSCPFPTRGNLSLTGKGTLVGVIDSGIEVCHPEFIRPNGKSGIKGIWDQVTQKVYSEEEIQESIDKDQCLIADLSGHGTHVTSIAAGNNGMAPDADILFVKLGRGTTGELSKTTYLMEAVTWLYREAVRRNQPIGINISYGTNYGNHRGKSLVETFLDEISHLWKLSICVGMGNEGTTGRHSKGFLKENQTEVVEFLVAPYETSLNLQIWKNYLDNFYIMIRDPGGREQMILENNGTERTRVGTTNLSYIFGTPSPYNQEQEIFLSFGMERTPIESGIWTLLLISKEISYGGYDMWLPVAETTSASTRFLSPSTELTLTIPASSSSVISVGAYDANTRTPAGFSGRGDYGECVRKPDLVAPGVNIYAAAPGGEMTIKSGTSMAVPFVTGAVAVLMEWGIVLGHDPFLYGEKMKAYLKKGAKPLPGNEEIPNSQTGWGALCVRNSIPL